MMAVHYEKSIGKSAETGVIFLFQILLVIIVILYITTFERESFEAPASEFIHSSPPPHWTLKQVATDSSSQILARTLQCSPNPLTAPLSSNGSRRNIRLATTEANPRWSFETNSSNFRWLCYTIVHIPIEFWRFFSKFFNPLICILGSFIAQFFSVNYQGYKFCHLKSWFWIAVSLWN